MTYRRWLPGLAFLGLMVCLWAGTTAAAPPAPVDHGPTPSPTPTRPAALVVSADTKGRLHPALYRTLAEGALAEAQPDTYHRIILEAGGKTYDYHSAGAGVGLCQPQKQ